jgi:hypothetical protein
MSITAREAFDTRHSVEGSLIEVDGLVRAANATEVSSQRIKPWLRQGNHPEPYNLYGDYSHTITRDGAELGRAKIDTWIEELDEGAVRMASIEEVCLDDSFNNHSAYLALLRQVVNDNPEAMRLEGFAENDMAAVTLDLDTFNLLPEGWAAKYYLRKGGALVELQYPIEVYEHLRDGELVYHAFERLVES